ncbi:MAG: rRNA maturation RNase YbeY [Thermodesulfovibrionales bacterium]
MKVYIKNQQRSIRISQQRLRRDSLRLLRSLNPELASRAELGILLVSDRRMKSLNHLYRYIDRTTDVLSFPQMGSNELKDSLPVTRYPLLPLGDIVINLQAAKRQSSMYGLNFYEEVRRLLIHGFLHLLGYDHEGNLYQERKMKKKERELQNALETLD